MASSGQTHTLYMHSKLAVETVEQNVECVVLIIYHNVVNAINVFISE